MIGISIIIPTYNNSRILKMSLEALKAQAIKKDVFEIIIVDDGSTMGEIKEIRNIIKELEIKIIFLSQKHAGPAKARNLGIKNAKGRIILLVNDDTVMSQNFVESHLKFHESHLAKKFALLTFLTWHPALKISPFMYWLEHGGPYFSFNELSDGKVSWEKFWTCGISVKKELLLDAGLFDEQFPSAAWEDIELGYRLSQEGLKLLYDKSITAYHYHPTSVRSIKNKMLANGKTLMLLKGKIPRKYHQPLARYSKLAIFLDRLFLPKPVFVILENIAFFSEKRFILHILYTIVLLHYRIEGLRRT